MSKENDFHYYPPKIILSHYMLYTQRLYCNAILTHPKLKFNRIKWGVHSAWVRTLGWNNYTGKTISCTRHFPTCVYEHWSVWIYVCASVCVFLWQYNVCTRRYSLYSMTVNVVDIRTLQSIRLQWQSVLQSTRRFNNNYIINHNNFSKIMIYRLSDHNPLTMRTNYFYWDSRNHPYLIMVST